MINRRLTRALAVAGLAIVVTAPLADAHVTVNPGEAPKGGFAKLAFRVPNKRDHRHRGRRAWPPGRRLRPVPAPECVTDEPEIVEYTPLPAPHGRVSRKIKILRTGGNNRGGRAVAPAKAAGAPILFLPLSGSGSHRRHRRTPPATVAAAPALVSFP